jgi:hypothetical protein
MMTVESLLTSSTYDAALTHLPKSSSRSGYVYQL